MRTHRLLILSGLIGLVLAAAPSFRAVDTLPRTLTDDAYWKMVSDFSEEGGYFRFEYMSNEREFQYVIPRLKATIKPGGTYLGVGPEQNFTYIAATQPKMAFIFDIRRQNLVEHLIYKALFEMSANRVDFISKLFSRRIPAGLTDKSTVSAIFQGFGTSAPDDRQFAQNLQAIKDRLIKQHGFQLTSQDLSEMDQIYETVFRGGPGPGRNELYGGGFGRGATYADLMTETDGKGQARSYLATEENFALVRQMHRENLIVPLVGDFAGPKALRTVGQYLKDHGAAVSVFYTSNVEQYLFQQGDDWSRFFTNVAAMPLDSSSTFIRSSHIAYDSASGRPSRVVAGGNFISLLCPMRDLITAFSGGRVDTYDQVIQMSK
jgi:hypothetical protein